MGTVYMNIVFLLICGFLVELNEGGDYEVTTSPSYSRSLPRPLDYSYSSKSSWKYPSQETATVQAIAFAYGGKSKKGPTKKGTITRAPSPTRFTRRSTTTTPTPPTTSRTRRSTTQKPSITNKKKKEPQALGPTKAPRRTTTERIMDITKRPSKPSEKRDSTSSNTQSKPKVDPWEYGTTKAPRRSTTEKMMYITERPSKLFEKKNFNSSNTQPKPNVDHWVLGTTKAPSRSTTEKMMVITERPSKLFEKKNFNSSNTQPKPNVDHWVLGTTKAPSRSTTKKRMDITKTPFKPIVKKNSTTQKPFVYPPLPGKPQNLSMPNLNQKRKSEKLKTELKIYNNYPGFYHLPEAHSRYPGYYHTPSHYQYSSRDTGNDVLGFYLGYSLAKITTPTYSHYSFYDGYRPKYDHYTLIHHQHNREQAPIEPIIHSNTIVGCIGDSGTICPENTTSLCTSDGTLMCVVSTNHTRPCTRNYQMKCVGTTLRCFNTTARECRNLRENSKISLLIPCVTHAKIFGKITYFNNTIIAHTDNFKKVVPGLFLHSDLPTTPIPNLATTPQPIYTPQYPITTPYVPKYPTTTPYVPTTMPYVPNYPTTTPYFSNYPIYSTPPYMANYQIITTPKSIETYPRGIVNQQFPQHLYEEFCVAIIAKPAEKVKSEGEKVYDSAKNVISRFIINAWGLH